MSDALLTGWASFDLAAFMEIFQDFGCGSCACVNSLLLSHAHKYHTLGHLVVKIGRYVGSLFTVRGVTDRCGRREGLTEYGRLDIGCMSINTPSKREGRTHFCLPVKPVSVKLEGSEQRITYVDS